MKYRELGKTGLKVSEIGLGGEWLARHTEEEVKAVIARAYDQGINILDCWMSEPSIRSKIGAAIAGNREKWIIQGHIGSTWQDGQYVRSRDMEKVREAFSDLLTRLQTEYIDLGMIHYVDEIADYRSIMDGEFIEYARELKKTGIIRHLGMSTHNPIIGKLAVENHLVEMLLFSINPAFDLLPPTENIDDYFRDNLSESFGVLDPKRAELYKLCEQNGVGITVMKPFAGGRLLDAKRSPLGLALTPIQCLHYALTRPAVASVLAGYDTPEQIAQAIAYETADDAAKDYAAVLAEARPASYKGLCTYCGHCHPCPMHIDIAMVNKLYDLATMQDEVPASIREHYRSLDVHADACVRCHGCEARCPFDVNVTERMKLADMLFR